MGTEQVLKLIQPRGLAISESGPAMDLSIIMELVV